MKKILLSILVVMAGLSLRAATPVLATQADSLNYFIGMLNGMRMRQSITTENEVMPDVKLNVDLFKQGTIDGLNADTVMSEPELMDYLQSQFAIQEKKFTERKQSEERAFLEKNGKRKGVKTTASGLQYEVLKGVKSKNPVHPADTSKVTVHYEGKLLDGKIFDSSYQRNEPITFDLNKVIKGWTEGLKLMQAGEKFRLFIPYELGYGERGAGEHIPPYSTLVFDVELLEIK